MSEKSEAQRLADALDCEGHIGMSKAAAELRRLEAENAELLEAIRSEMDPAWDCNSYHPKMHAAIEKHGSKP